jgi:hypothetical protein
LSKTDHSLYEKRPVSIGAAPGRVIDVHQATADRNDSTTATKMTARLRKINSGKIVQDKMRFNFTGV